MNWILEEDGWLLVLGTVATLATGGLWLRTGLRPLLLVCGGAVLTTALLVTISRLVETDRERIAATLNQIADDVRRNDLEAVLAHVHSTATGIRRRAELEFPLYVFHEVRIQENLEIDVHRGAAAKTAEARFNVVVVASDRQGFLEMRRVPRYVVVSLREEEGNWSVIDYRHADAMEGLRRGENADR